MNIAILIANILVFLTFVLHAFGADRQYKMIEPETGNPSNLETWTMGRLGFHMGSVDFLLASIGLTLINFTEYFSDKKLLLNILSVYFFAYGLAFLIILIISKKFPNRFIKLWQWLLMFAISGLIYYGAN